MGGVREPLPRSGLSQSSTFVNMHHILACYDNKSISFLTRRSLPWVLWQIWKTRNIFTFEKSTITPIAVISKAKEDAEAWYGANATSGLEGEGTGTGMAGIGKWHPPPGQFTKCNIGCSWVNPLRNCGVAWILRDTLGNTLFHSRRSYSRVESLIEAELMSLLWAVENLGRLRQKRVIFETSCRPVMEIINTPSQYTFYAGLVAEIHHFLARFEEWSITFTPVSCNNPALRISQSVISDNRDQSYIAQGAPRWLISVIALDRP